MNIDIEDSYGSYPDTLMTINSHIEKMGHVVRVAGGLSLEVGP